MRVREEEVEETILRLPGATGSGKRNKYTDDVKDYQTRTKNPQI